MNCWFCHIGGGDWRTGANRAPSRATGLCGKCRSSLLHFGNWLRSLIGQEPVATIEELVP